MRYFTTRELLSRFHGSALGIGWVLIHPLFLFGVYYFVFGTIMGRGAGGNKLEFALYLFTGMFAFHSVAGATNGSLSSVVSNGNLVRKVAFPCELLPLIPVLVETVVMLVGLAAGVAVGIAAGILKPGWELALLPWFLVILIGFSTGLGLLLSNLNVFWRDVRHIYQIITTAWFFVSPCFWTPDFLEKSVPAWARAPMNVNPLYHLLIAERQIFGFREASLGLAGSVVANLLIASGWAIAALVIGYGAFMTNKHQYADLI